MYVCMVSECMHIHTSIMIINSHQVRGHGVAHKRGGNLLEHQLKRREAAALVVWSCLCAEGVVDLAGAVQVPVRCGYVCIHMHKCTHDAFMLLSPCTRRGGSCWFRAGACIECRLYEICACVCG